MHPVEQQRALRQVDRHGTQRWFIEGRQLRDRHPAEALASDSDSAAPDFFWTPRGCQGQWQLHRGHDLPAVIHTNGSMAWWHLGRQHRDADAPALVWRCDHYNQWCHQWYTHGKLHREWHAPAATFAPYAPSAYVNKPQWWRHGAPQTPAQVQCSRRWSPLRAAFFAAAAAAALAR